MLRNVVRYIEKLRGLSLLNRLVPRKMDVTRHNFQSLLPEIQEAINDASFICIDGEFTGLNAYRNISPYDLPQQRYDKLQESSRQFLLIQFGICTFHYDPKNGSYTNQAFNFYVWPRPNNRQAPDPRFLCQTSSLDFLISQNFDFNKLIKDGISYLRPMEVEKLRSATLERQEYIRGLNTPDQNIIAIPQDQEQFIKEVTETLQTFVDSDEEKTEICSKCNAFQRRLVYQTARQNFPTLGLLGMTRPDGERVISVSKDSASIKKEEQIKDLETLENVEAALGFSKVIKMMSDSKKLVVGHNMVLDICHTLNQFCAPLPADYVDFKEMANTIFPNILDTKLMANTIPFKDEIMNTSLGELLKTVSEKPYHMLTIKPRKEGYGYNETDDKYHEAGYDAYVTGLCLISMHKRMCKLCGTTVCGVSAESQVLKPFLNKLYLMKVADIPYMNLGAEDMYPDRDHVFHLEIPKHWKTQDLVSLFSIFGHVNVFWINDTSTFVSLREKSFANTVLQKISSNNMFTISTYKDFILRMEAKKETEQNSNTEGSNDKSLNSSQSTPQPSPYRVDKRQIHTGWAGPGLKRGMGLATTRTATPSSQTGITPMMERTFVDGIKGQALKRSLESDETRIKKGKAEINSEKRPVSPDSRIPGVKRSKSIVEEKTFEEPSWE